MCRAQVVEFLVLYGANVNSRDRWGGDPLKDAMRGGHAKVAFPYTLFLFITVTESTPPQNRQLVVYYYGFVGELTF